MCRPTPGGNSASIPEPGIDWGAEVVEVVDADAPGGAATVKTPGGWVSGNVAGECSILPASIGKGPVREAGYTGNGDLTKPLAGACNHGPWGVCIAETELYGVYACCWMGGLDRKGARGIMGLRDGEESPDENGAVVLEDKGIVEPIPGGPGVAGALGTPGGIWKDGAGIILKVGVVALDVGKLGQACWGTDWVAKDSPVSCVIPVLISCNQKNIPKLVGILDSWIVLFYPLLTVKQTMYGNSKQFFRCIQTNSS